MPTKVKKILRIKMDKLPKTKAKELIKYLLTEGFDFKIWELQNIN